MNGNGTLPFVSVSGYTLEMYYVVAWDEQSGLITIEEFVIIGEDRLYFGRMQKSQPDWSEVFVTIYPCISVTP